MSVIPFKNPQCPRCCNKDAYVTLMVPAPLDEGTDEYVCDCGKCGLRYRALVERHAWLTLQTAPAQADHYGALPGSP